ncbi:MAG: hypothetical protein R3F23_07205 [Verrucomicrobiia bacterium]
MAGKGKIGRRIWAWFFGEKRVTQEVGTLNLLETIRTFSVYQEADKVSRAIRKVSDHAVNLVKTAEEGAQKALDRLALLERSESGNVAVWKPRDGGIGDLNKLNEQARNLKEVAERAYIEALSAAHDARNLSNRAKAIAGDSSFTGAQRRSARQLASKADQVVALADRHAAAIKDAENALKDVVGRTLESSRKNGTINVSNIVHRWEEVKRALATAETTGQEAAKAAEEVYEAAKILHPITPQARNGAILAASGGVDHGDYRPQLPPHPLAPVGETVGEGVIKGLEAIDWMETKALNLGGTAVTGAASLVTGGHVPVITDFGDRLNRVEEAFGEATAKVVREDGKRLDAAFQQAEKQTAGFLDQMDRDALSGGKAWLGF